MTETIPALTRTLPYDHFFEALGLGERNDDNIVATDLTAWCGTSRSFVGRIRVRQPKGDSQFHSWSRPEPPDQIVSWSGRGVLVHFSVPNKTARKWMLSAKLHKARISRAGVKFCCINA
jgi:hypothetical protein